jgi:hypothetical protein
VLLRCFTVGGMYIFPRLCARLSYWLVLLFTPYTTPLPIDPALVKEILNWICNLSAFAASQGGGGGGREYKCFVHDRTSIYCTISSLYFPIESPRCVRVCVCVCVCVWSGVEWLLYGWWSDIPLSLKSRPYWLAASRRLSIVRLSWVALYLSI